jgi:Membrane dipeptidase (Peptidase family M19)
LFLWSFLSHLASSKAVSRFDNFGNGERALLAPGKLYDEGQLLIRDSVRRRARLPFGRPRALAGRNASSHCVLLLSPCAFGTRTAIAEAILPAPFVAPPRAAPVPSSAKTRIRSDGTVDGISTTPRGLEDISKLPAVTAELLRRGMSEADVDKVLGANLLRVLEANEP